MSGTVGEGNPGRWVLLGHAGPHPQAAGRRLDARRLHRRRRRRTRPTATTGRTPRRSRSPSIPSRPRTGTCSSSSSRSTTRRRVNRQGNDIGTSYRSAIFYLDDEQRRVAEDTIADVDASGLWPGKVVTEVTPGRAVLGGRARAPGLPRALPERLHLPLRASGLGAAPPGRRSRRIRAESRVQRMRMGAPGIEPGTSRV